MKSRIGIILTIVFLAISVHEGFAQNCQVNGIVTDADTKDAIANASIVYSYGGKKYSCTTDTKGTFSFSLPQGINTTVKVTHLGYKPISKVVAGNKKQ